MIYYSPATDEVFLVDGRHVQCQYFKYYMPSRAGVSKFLKDYKSCFIGYADIVD